MEAVTIKERPVLFSGPMVRAILDGRKTQTRRLVKPQFGKVWGYGVRHNDTVFSIHVDIAEADGSWKWIRCPFGKAGDRLWVRETFCRSRNNTFYRCDGANLKFKPNELSEEWDWDRGCGEKWTPSIHMNRCYSRITLEITRVRVERLNDISEVDAISEGALTLPNRLTYEAECQAAKAAGEKPPVGDSPRERFRRLWTEINGDGSWELNPWVWVVEFKVL